MPIDFKYLDSFFMTHFDSLKVLRIKILLSFSLFLPQQFVAQKYSQDSIKTLINGCLQYIKNDQIKVTVPAFQYKGEWPTYMCLQKSYPLLGKPKRYYDSNCFSIASIHNMLAETYFSNPEFTEIAAMLELAYPQIMSYKSKNGGFNFWPLLPASGRLRQLARNNRTDFVRRPVQFRMLMPYIRKLVGISGSSVTVLSVYGLQIRLLQRAPGTVVTLCFFHRADVPVLYGLQLSGAVP